MSSFKWMLLIYVLKSPYVSIKNFKIIMCDFENGFQKISSFILAVLPCIKILS